MIKAISAPIEEKEEGRNYLDSFFFFILYRREEVVAFESN